MKLIETTIHCPPNSPTIAPQNFHLFLPKDELVLNHYAKQDLKQYTINIQTNADSQSLQLQNVQNNELDINARSNKSSQDDLGQYCDCKKCDGSCLISQVNKRLLKLNVQQILPAEMNKLILK